MKLAVISTDLKYLDNFITRFKAAGNEVDIYKPGQDAALNTWKLKGLCDWADLIWCEFCEHPMAQITNYVTDKPIIARLWRHEVYNPVYMNSIKWDRVNLLLVATTALKDRFLKSRNQKLEPKETKSFFTPSVDVEKFKYVDRTYTEEIKLCIIGDVIPRKRQLEAVQLLLDLPEQCTLSIVGAFVNTEYIIHVQNLIKGNDLAERVHVYGAMDHSMLPEFLGDHDVYLSMSAEETAHFAAAEAMATGCYPVLNWWPGINDVYPASYICKRFATIIAAIKKWDGFDKDTKKSQALKVRDFSEQEFSADTEYVEIMKYIDSILGRLNEDSTLLKILPQNLRTVRNS
tara:strand:+ start:522 stop:1556 length:1035 start_codon:yes stop_codon:yes gene_type:complete